MDLFTVGTVGIGAVGVASLLYVALVSEVQDRRRGRERKAKMEAIRERKRAEREAHDRRRISLLKRGALAEDLGEAVVTCEHGHVCRYKEFSFELELTADFAADGYGAVGGTATGLKVARVRMGTRFGCPVCQTSAFTFQDPEGYEYVECTHQNRTPIREGGFRDDRVSADRDPQPRHWWRRTEDHRDCPLCAPPTTLRACNTCGVTNRVPRDTYGEAPFCEHCGMQMY